MNNAKLLSGLAGGAIVAVSVLGLAPATQADESSGNGGHNSAVDPGRARNDIGNYQPATDPAPLSDGGSGIDTQDIVLGSVAGLVAVVGVAGTVVSIRRRHPMAHHPA
jgi:hypothetical protein